MKIKMLEFWVGLFVILGMLALLMLSLQVSGLSSLTSEKGYELKAVFKNIGGLKIRSKVTINGVKIGTVEHINLIQDEFNEYQALVLMKINYPYNNLPRDSAAKILTSGLLGDNYIGIEPGVEDLYLKPGDTIELTQQALLLEDLIAKFAVNSSGNKAIADGVNSDPKVINK